MVSPQDQVFSLAHFLLVVCTGYLIEATRRTMHLKPNNFKNEWRAIPQIEREYDNIQSQDHSATHSSLYIKEGATRKNLNRRNARTPGKWEDDDH